MSLLLLFNGAAGETQHLRGLQFLSFSDIGNPMTLSVADDGGGGGTATWNVSGTTLCRLDPIRSNSRITGGAIDERSTYLVTTPPDVFVDTTDRFAIAGRGLFEITAVRSRTDQPVRIFEAIQVS